MTEFRCSWDEDGNHISCEVWIYGKKVDKDFNYEEAYKEWKEKQDASKT